MALITRRALPLFVLVLLAGCVKYDEHIEVDENGKGKATLTLTRPKRGLIDKLRVRSFDNRFSKEALTNGLPAGVTGEWQESEKDERIEVRMVYTYDDINKLLGWAAKTEYPHPLNNISVKRQDQTLEFTRRFSALDKEEMEAVQKYAIDAAVTFKITGPGSLKGHNATRAEGNTVIWELKVPQLFEQGGKSFTATYFFGTPTVLYLLIAFAAVLAVVVVLKVLKKKPAAPPSAA